jgi:hypothetical protein
LPPDALLLDQFLAYLERRRAEAQRRFDELTVRRGSMSMLERNLARDSLRTQAAALTDELRRLKLAAAMTRGLLRPPLSDSQGTRLDRAEPRQRAYS